MTDWTLPTAKSVQKSRLQETQEKRRREVVSNLEYFKKRVDELIRAMDENLQYKCGSGIPKSVLQVIDVKISDYFDDAPALTMGEILKQKGWKLEDNGTDLTLKGIEE